jgi:hypothetical protein
MMLKAQGQLNPLYELQEFSEKKAAEKILIKY